MRLGAGDDRLIAAPVTLPLSADGGPGAAKLRSEGGSVSLSGGDGDDALRAAGPEVVLVGGRGADRLQTASAATATWQDEEGSVEVDLRAGVARTPNGIETLVGEFSSVHLGTGADRVSGGDGADSLYGGQDITSFGWTGRGDRHPRQRLQGGPHPGHDPLRRVIRARPKPLFLGGDDCFSADGPSQFVIAGRLLAYVNTTCDTVSGSDTVIVVDLRTRKRRYQAAATTTPAAAAADVYAGVETLAIARGGETAWIATYQVPGGQPRTYEVRRSTPTNRESMLLDTGTDVLPDSLAVSPNLVYWTRGAAARSAPLR